MNQSKASGITPHQLLTRTEEWNEHKKAAAALGITMKQYIHDGMELMKAKAAKAK